jgi:hypothetical protein
MAKYRFDIPGIEKFMGDMKSRSVRVARGATQEVMERVINDAPVDTGFMVATARVRLNPKRSLAARDRPPKYFEPDAQELKKDEVKGAVKAMKIGDALGLSFVAKYTKWVHEGTSHQVAQPFVTINVIAWPSIVRKYVALYKKAK